MTLRGGVGTGNLGGQSGFFFLFAKELQILE